MTTFRAPILLVAFLFMGALPSQVWADTIVELREKIERTQDEYDETLATYNKAVTVATAYLGEVEAAEDVLGLRTEEVEAALEKLQKVQELSRERPDVSDEEEKNAYAAAQGAYDSARVSLNEKRIKLTTAKGDATTLLTTLNGYRRELANLKHQLANIQFRGLQESLSQEKTVVVREELGCEDLTIRACKQGALELAQRSAVEQGSAVLLESTTIMEDLSVILDSITVAEDRQVTKDRIESQVTGILVSYEVLDKGLVGETGYFYRIEAVVIGQVSKEQFFEIAGIETLPPLPPDPAADAAHSDTVPGSRFRDCADCPELVVVPAGSFIMGSPSWEEGHQDDESPMHRVVIDQPFAVGIHEVTRGEFTRFVWATDHATEASCRQWKGATWHDHEGRNWLDPGYQQGGDHPVTCVNWDDAQAYVVWLSRHTGKGYRLLSESEWEYVARGGTSTARYWGESESEQCRNANGADQQSALSWATSCDDGFARTAPVGSFTKNPFGLYDAVGNVWEWTQDCWNRNYVQAPRDGSAWETEGCGRRVARGGSWNNRPRELRSAIRSGSESGYRSNLLGFRVARTLTS